MILALLLLFLSSNVLAQAGPCTRIVGNIQGNTPKLVGCEFGFSVEFCPLLHKSATSGWVNSATAIVSTRTTKNLYISPCGTRTKVFATLRNAEFKLAKDLSKDLNMTTGEAVFTTSVLYTTQFKAANTVPSEVKNVTFIMRWIKDQTDELAWSVTLQHTHNQANTISIADVSDNIQNCSSIHRTDSATQPFPAVIPAVNSTASTAHTTEHAQSRSHTTSAITGHSGSTVDQSKLTSQECNLDHMIPGQWEYSTVKADWVWKPHLCTLDLVKKHGFLHWAKQYQLKTVMFIGTSRMRTFYYDLLSYFGFSADEIAANKAHHHMSHSILAYTGVNITLHYHWNDCEGDAPKGATSMGSYQHTLAELARHFDEIGVCTHMSSIPTYYQRNADFKAPPAADTHPYAVVMSTGICEMHKIQIQNFRQLVSSIVQFVHESCTGHMQSNSAHSDGTDTVASGTTNPNIFLFKLEESIDIKIMIAQPLFEANDYLYHHVIPALNKNLPVHAHIPILDTYHISRAWKIYEDAVDGWHYYGEGFLGDTASQSIVALILTKFVHKMRQNLYTMQSAVVSAPHADNSVVYDQYSGKILSVKDSTQHSVHAFPAVEALPYVYRIAVVDYEGNLLYNPYNRREIFVVHDGIKHPLPDWDTFLALDFAWREMIYIDKSAFEALPTGPAIPSVNG